jgi:hypothetical protein
MQMSAIEHPSIEQIREKDELRYLQRSIAGLTSVMGAMRDARGRFARRLGRSLPRAPMVETDGRIPNWWLAL